MIFNEKTITSEKVFQGRIIDVRVETVEFDDGRRAYRELVDHPGGVGVVALTDDNKIIMVKQFRKPIEEAIWEIPAGKLDRGEDPLECGKRELEEETGFKAREFVSLGYFYPSPGFANEVTHLFFAKGLYPGKTNPDEDEFLDVEEIELEEIRDMIAKNQINDAKTVIAFLKCELLNLF